MYAGNRLYHIDHDFFEDIATEEQAYILGFICADGCVHNSGKSVSVFVQKKDEHILNTIKQHTQNTSPIQTKIRSSGYAKGGILVGINLCSRKMVRDLALLGIMPCKSLTIEIPKIQHHLSRHLIRGIWDGDGHIGPRQIFLAGNDRIINTVKDLAEVHTGTILKVDYNNGSPRLHGNRSSKVFLDWLYHNSTIHLERKYDSYIKHWSCIPRARVASSP